MTDKEKLELFDNPLSGYDALKRQLRQMDINVNWLISQFDIVHECLCPGRTGTWQMRVQQSVEVAKQIKEENLIGD